MSRTHTSIDDTESGLPRTGPRRAQRDALQRISINVAHSIAQRTQRRERVWKWQPALAGVATLLLLIGVFGYQPAKHVAPKPNTSLLSALAPELSSESITSDALDIFESEYYSTPEADDTDQVNSVYTLATNDEFWSNGPEYEQLSESEQQELMNRLVNDPNLEWSELS